MKRFAVSEFMWIIRFIPLIYLSMLCLQVVKCDEEFTLVGNYCSGSSHVTQNIDNLFKKLSQEAYQQNFYRDMSDQVYGLFHCREDLNHQDCGGCIEHLQPIILQACPNSAEAIFWSDKCTLLYSNHSSFPLDNETPFAWTYSLYKFADPNQFAQVLSNLLNHLIGQATSNSSGRHFAVGDSNLTSSEKLYALVQCDPDPDMSGLQCRKCLQMASDKLHQCCNATKSAMVFLPSCQLMYDMNQFYGLPIATSRGLHVKFRKTVLIVILLTVGIGVLVPSGIWFCLRQRKANRIQKVDINEMRIVESLQFNLSTIKAATNNFSDENKLGRGGFGEVYKGKLATGQEIAVKRLSRNSEQGILEFKNEVVLVAKLQHRNLVQLLGFCVAAKEKILIYELLCNSSLDRFLYDPVKRKSLDWHTRFKIINGIARGLLYLHEDSRLKIIHRDLKCSNILLDEAMNPKISDFGIAKLVALDHTQGDTSRVVGTYGYMAPEYAMAGQFSVKSDVYSFGIIVLEVVSGQKNSILHQKHKEGLVERAWRLWNQGAVLQLLDSLLDDDFSSEEVRTAVHISLLCIQQHATMRPTMASVVTALNGQSITLPLPTQPHIFTFVAVDHDSTSTTNYHSLQVQDRVQPICDEECVRTTSTNAGSISIAATCSE